MSFDGLRDVVGRFLTEASIQVARPGAAGYDAHGRPEPAASTAFYIDAAYYPATPKALLSLPEGDRHDAPRMVVWTNSSIALGDQIQIDNATWEVEAIEFWLEANTFKALARKVTTP